MYVNIIFSTFLQIKDYENYDSFSMGSIVIAHIILIACLTVLGLLVYKIISFFN